MKILMVCLGNICRSPLAHGILQDQITRLNLDWEVDSAGTSGWHQGQKPDRRSIAVALTSGLDISNQRSRQLTRADLINYDLILVMDDQNLRDTLSMCGDDLERNKVKRIRDFVDSDPKQIPDPYYEGGFEYVYNLLQEACEGVINTYSQLLITK